jgi:hypothetical protein
MTRRVRGTLKSTLHNVAQAILDSGSSAIEAVLSASPVVHGERQCVVSLRLDCGDFRIDDTVSAGFADERSFQLLTNWAAREHFPLANFSSVKFRVVAPSSLSSWRRHHDGTWFVTVRCEAAASFRSLPTVSILVTQQRFVPDAFLLSERLPPRPRPGPIGADISTR